mgnify:CR=1 FL=1
MAKNKLRIGDTVKVISGFDKNQTGEITKIYKKTDKIMVQSVNYKIKHIKPNTEKEVGEIKRIQAPIHRSNVKLLNK